jgi:FkbM family methyltransferase
VSAAWLQTCGAFVARHRRHLLFRGLARLSRGYLDWHANLDYELSRNGEDFVLQVLGRLAPRVIVDAGANVGDWTLAARRRCATAQIHAFEIAAPTHATLCANTAGDVGIRCHNLGLSDRDGSIAIRHFDGAPALTTATHYPHPLTSTELSAQVVRGDTFLAGLGVSHVDMLKIDVEGMEDQVLRGFDGLLSQRRVDLVQFEYGRVNILNHFLLADCHTFFLERGYLVGKVYPDQVDFRPYELSDEDFRGPNYLACRADRPDLLAALGGSPRRARTRTGSDGPST